jgi:glycosyltransferase involved in cell wall biosynthesis
MIKSKENYIEPLVSIIVTTFNRKDKLQEAILSILEQSYNNFEIVVVDNFSDYDIKDFIKKFNDNRIRLIQNNNGGNYVINRNLGIKQSHGDYVAFCDDDDYWLPHKLTEQMAFFNASEDDQKLGLVYSKCFMLGSKGIYRVGPRVPLYNGNVFYWMLLIPSVPILTAVVKKQVFNKIGYFNEDKSILCQEDNDFWIRLSKYFSVKSIAEPTAVYREHDENLSNSNQITIKARLYLHKHMIKTGVITYFEWIFWVFPGLFIVLFLKFAASVLRRTINALRFDSKK